MQQLYYILLFCVSASEFVIGYYLLFHTILDWGSLTLFDKSAVLMGVVLPSLLLTINRGLTFFSDLIFLFVVVIDCLLVYFIKKKEFWFIASYVWLFFSVVALTDICIAFLSMAIFEKNFIELIYYRSASLWQIIVYIASRAVVLISCKYFIKNGWEINEEYTGAFLMIDVILFLVLKRYQRLIVKMSLGEIYMDGLNGGFSLLTAVVVVMLFMVLVMKNQIMQKEKRFLELHVQMTEQSYLIQHQNLEVNHQLVHDMKHHLLFLRKLVEEKDIEQIEDYLDEIEKEYVETDEVTWTGNRFLDFILNQKKKKAEDNGIQMSIKAEIVPKWNLTENEMSVMFGNLLDNAIEACEKVNKGNKWICLSVKKRAGIILIEIGNSCGIFPDVQQDRIISSKQNRQLHGYGLKSVKRIVERQKGCIEWRVLQHEFYINISFFDSDRWKEGEECVNRKL